MNLNQLFLTKNECYQVGAKMTPIGIMVHSTGANNPWLCRYVQPDDGTLGANKYGNHFNQKRPGNRQVCVHAFIGKRADGSVATYQTLPWDMQGWHAGGKANKNYIGFEICEDDLKGAVYFGRVYKEAVELCAYLCKKFGFDPKKDILCHSEGYKKGIASNHGDVMHWFPKHGKSMDTFRADVADVMKREVESMTEEMVRKIVRDEVEKMEAERAKEPVSKWAKELLAEAKAKGLTDGTRPGSYVTREEAAVMALRASQ